MHAEGVAEACTMKYNCIFGTATKTKWEIINNGLKGECLFHT